MDAGAVTILVTVVGGGLAAGAMLYQLGLAALNALALYDLAVDARELHERYQARLALLRGEALDVEVLEDGEVGVEAVREAA